MVYYEFGQTCAKVTVEDGRGNAYIKVNGILVAWLNSDGTIWRSTSLLAVEQTELKKLGFKIQNDGVKFGNYQSSEI